MDTKIEKKQPKLKIVFKIVLVLILLGSLGFYVTHQSKVCKVNQTDLTIAEVQFGTFEDLLLLNTTAQSLHFSLLTVLEGGVVKEIFVEDGQMVTKGQPLARIYNPTSELNYLTQETNINQQLTQLRSALLDLKNQETVQNKELLQTQNEFNTALQNFNLQKRLLDAEIGRKADYELALQHLNYFKSRKQIVEKGQVNDVLARKSQQKSIQATLFQLEKSLSVLKQNKDNFLILASSHGRLSSFNISLGQNLRSGDILGKIDLMQGYKLVAKVDEFYHNKVRQGLKGVLENTDKPYPIELIKMIPEIKDGQFGVELQFLNQIPKDLKIGMGFGAKIKLSSDTHSFMISKGNFYKDTAGKWVFVLLNGKAVKRKITIGRENTFYYEVLSGLKENEKVIVSDYSEYKDFEALQIN